VLGKITFTPFGMPEFSVSWLMKNHVVTNIARVLIVSWSIIAIWCDTSNAVERQSYRIPFLGGRTNIEFRQEKTQEEIGVGAYITGVTTTGSVFVDAYEPEGGAAPEIKSVFVSGRKPRKLFVIVAWATDSPSIGTGGSIYRVFAYGERIEKDGTLPKLRQDAELIKRFGIGFDGTREGRSITYKYKNAPAVKRQLLEWGYK
jgi:hypothetical protein